MASKKRRRSRFWIVSTHVLTTGFAMPVVALLVAYAAITFLGLRGVAAFLLILAIGAIGYIGGTYYSLSYLRKSADTHSWSACVTPSVVVFAILNLIRLGLDLRTLAQTGVMIVAVLVAFYTVVTVAFARITRTAFTMNDSASSVGSDQG